jgi:hypothetical protein
MPVTRSNRDIQNLQLAMKALPQNLRDEGKEIVYETIKEGAEIMYSDINRIDTERMKASVSYSNVESTSKGVSGQWGWGLHGSEVKDYFKYQEYGTRSITPMHALLGSYIKMREKFMRRVELMVRNGGKIR